MTRRSPSCTVCYASLQVHPTALVDPKDPTNLSKFLGPETMRGEGGILVDGSGKRQVCLMVALHTLEVQWPRGLLTRKFCCC